MSINHPSQFDTARFGTIRIWLGPDEEWPMECREDIGLACFAARAWGPLFDFVAHEADADIAIRHADSGDVDPWAGRWTPSRHLIEIDPVQCHGRMERRRAVLHELGHMLGCGHVAAPTAVMFERL